MITSKEELYRLLEEIGISYQYFAHPPTHHFEEHREIRDKILGLHCKSLLLTDKKSFYLILMRGEERLDLKALQDHLKSKRLSFAKGEDMERILHVSPGSCTPYALINDKEHNISHVICDSAFQKTEKINFHPMENNMTIQVTFDDFITWLDHCAHQYSFINLEENKQA